MLAALRQGFEELLWPTRCVGCDTPGALICDACREELPWIAQRWACPNCGAPFGYITCTECSEAWETRAVVCAMGFDRTSSRMASCLKDAHELRLAGVNAAAMATSLDEAAAWDAPDGRPRYDPSSIDLLCFVPATPKAFARRGFDHMELVSRELAALTGAPLADVLVRDSEQDQRALGREERASNLAGTISVIEDVAGLNVLLADDVITTGASMREAARALLARGAQSVTGCALCRVW